MLKLRCPECGASLYEGSMKFPECHRCGTNALSCRGCASYDPKTGACTDVLSPMTTITDADARPECGRFRPLREVAESSDQPLGRRFWVYVAVGVAAVLLLALVAQLLGSRGPRAAEHLMRASVSLPDDVALGDTCTVEVFVDNRAEEREHAVAVRVSGHTLDDLQLQSVTPEPVGEEAVGKAKTFRFGPIEPGAEMRIRFAFACERQGRARLSFLVMDEANALVGHKQEQLRITP